jgi:hypothetical protein
MKSCLLGTALILLVTGFASCTRVYSPIPHMDNAKKMIEAARGEKADFYAPDLFNLAEKEFARAESELKDGNNNLAQRWARRASADAELSAVLARHERTGEEISDLKTKIE